MTKSGIQANNNWINYSQLREQTLFVTVHSLSPEYMGILSDGKYRPRQSSCIKVTQYTMPIMWRGIYVDVVIGNSPEII